MSRVLVRPLNALGGILPVTAFSDNFNRANNTNGFGENWICSGLNYSLAAAFSAIGPIGISVNQSVWQATATNQNIQNMPHGFMPVPCMSGLNGKSQFAQLTHISNNSIVGTRSMYIGVSILNGWTVVAGAGGFRQYIAPMFVDDTQSFVALNRFDGTNYANIGAPASFNIVANDVIRLQGRIAAGGGSVDLTIFVNGVARITATDNAASRSIFGSPGIHRHTYVTAAVPGTPTVVVDDFSCGLA